jgi:hypothetical protein
MTLDHDGILGSRLRALDVPVPTGLGARVVAAQSSPLTQTHPLPRRAALAAAGLAALLVANAAALYLVPTYSQAAAATPIAGPLLKAVGLGPSDGTTPIGSVAEAAGRRVALVEGTTDTHRTVLLFTLPENEMIPTNAISVKDQFGHEYATSFTEVYAHAVLTQGDKGFDRTALSHLSALRPGQMGLVLPPIAGQAARHGARLTIRIDQLAAATGPPTIGNGPPWSHPVDGPWTLTANLAVHDR